MKNVFVTSFLLLTTMNFASAAGIFQDAVVRVSAKKAKVQSVELKHLVQSDAFNGLHFKIVKGKSEEAIKFSDDKELVLRASTTYYHLNKARSYFNDKLESEYVRNMGTVTIRIDLKNDYSELGHYAHDKKDPQFNNALSIPAGENPRRNQKWGPEIWFRPSKKIHRDEINFKQGSGGSYKQVLTSFRSQTHMQTLSKFMMGLVQGTNFSSGNVYADTFRLVGSSLILELGYQNLDFISKKLSRRYYWLDTALVPEIIYHEYAHIALSDSLELTHSTPVIEGMADFFAGKIGGNHKLAAHIKKHNTFSGKNAKRKQQYRTQFETTGYANADFVFGMLWSMGDLLGEENIEKFIFILKTKINTNSSIRKDLIEGILRTCDEVCKRPSTDRLKLFMLFNKKGI